MSPHRPPRLSQGAPMRSPSRGQQADKVLPQVGRARVAIAFLLLAAVILGLGVRLVDVHAQPDERILDGVFIPLGVVTVPGPRGTVFDRNGRVIALSLPASTVVADPRLVEQPEAVALSLSGLLEVPVERLLERLQGEGAFKYLARQVDPEVGEKVMDLDFAGIDVIEEPRREHPNGDCSALSTIGRVNIDHVGMSGLEETFDNHLSGTEGQVIKEISIDGDTIPGGAQKVIEAKPGSDLTVTLDRNVQFQTEQLLMDAVAEADAGSGVVVVSLPATGEIIAMANVSRDRNGIVGCTRENLAATWTYEPGSVFKPVAMAAALDSGAAVGDGYITVPSYLTIWGHTFTDLSPHEEEDWPLAQILIKSSNIGAIKLAQITGERTYYDKVREFGFGERTALGLKGESKGIVVPLDDWNGLTLPTASIGQGLAVTPLQLTQMYNTIANDGVRVPLRIASSPADSPGQRVRVIEARTAFRLQDMLTRVVLEGTGKKAALPGFIMGGKTGTAWQPCDVGYLCLDESGEASGRHYTATFAGIVSNDRGPALVVVGIIDDPKGSQFYGGSLAAPLVRRVAQYAMRQLRIPVISQLEPDERVRAEPATVPTLPLPEDDDANPDAGGADT